MHFSSRFLVVSLGLLSLQSCGLSNNASDAVQQKVENAVRDLSSFPQSLMVSAPTEVDSVDTLTRSAPRAISYHGYATQRIDQLLAGSTPLRDVFNTENFFRLANNATCFGPELKYANHPDGSGASGTLPTGDLGLWTEKNGTTNEACSAAQLNAQMNGVRSRNFAGLSVLASLIDALYTKGESLPLDGETKTLTTEMNAKSIANTHFTLARLSRTGNQYLYEVKMVYSGLRGDDTSAQDYEIALTLAHTPDSTGNYVGNMTYQIQDKYQGGTCASSSSSAFFRMAHKGSLTYEKQAANHFVLDAREAQYCSDTLDASALSSANQLSATSAYSSSTPSGWSDNFRWFKAAFNQTDLAGHYAYTWQAGPNDSNSRVLNVGLNPSSLSDETGTLNADGEAWYGYGGSLSSSATTVGQINGFICNWAGPGGTGTLLEKAQRQFISKGTTGFYEPVTGGSNLTYAPTNSCFYSGGSFQYDRDLNGTLDSADIVKVVASPADATEIKYQLFPYTGLYFTDTTTYPDIESIITARGFSLPAAPAVP